MCKKRIIERFSEESGSEEVVLFRNQVIKNGKRAIVFIIERELYTCVKWINYRKHNRNINIWEDQNESISLNHLGT